MQTLNLLIIGNQDSNALKMSIGSKYIKKLYTNFEYKDGIAIKFNTFKELAIKCKSLKIDIVFVEDKKYILEGIGDILKNNFINCIALNSYWTQLILNNEFANNILSQNDIHMPERLRYPSEFPIVIKGQGFLKFANNLQEVVDYENYIGKKYPVLAKTLFLEKYIDGEEKLITTFFDGKNSISFSDNTIPKNIIEDYNQKLEKIFNSEHSKFLGFISSRVIYANDTLYHLGFNLNLPILETDFVFLLISAIYQKLNEIE